MYEPVIGLEVHVQLKTKTKVFCACRTEFGKEANTQVCPVCLGFPGSLPVLNKAALEYTIKVGLALNCCVQEWTKFDRKHYYYPDLPKNYQISQYDLPIAKHGFLDIELNNIHRRVYIKRVHLEEDAGKLIHQTDATWVDFNRTGMPLLEIVTEPDLNSPEEAYEYLISLKGIIEYLGVSDCNMEKGSLRCDANVSVRKKGASQLGVKTELKNMNSFKGVKDALGFEIERQKESAGSGGVIVQETRLWDVKEFKTFPMRTKEEAKDYRYFPEPDLPPFIISKDKIEDIKQTIPELPKQKSERFMKDYGLSKADAEILVYSKKNADYAEECFKLYPNANKKPMVNLLIGPLFAEANTRNCLLADLSLSASNLIDLLGFIDKDAISNRTAKAVLKEMLDSGRTASKIIQEKNLVSISDSCILDKEIDEVIKSNQKSVQDYQQGKGNALMFLIGQVMKKTQGRANPKAVQEILKKKLL